MARKLVPRIPRWCLAVLVIAGLCTAIVSLWLFSSRTISRRSAIRALDERHGTYGVRLTSPSWVRTIVTKLGGDEKLFYNPLRVSLGPGNVGYDPASPVGDSDLRALGDHLAAFPDLEVLDLSLTKVSDEGIAALPALPALKVLRLDGTRVTDGLAPSLSKFPRLAEVSLYHTAVTEQGIAEIKRRCPGCAVKP